MAVLPRLVPLQGLENTDWSKALRDEKEGRRAPARHLFQSQTLHVAAGTARPTFSSYFSGRKLTKWSQSRHFLGTLRQVWQELRQAMSALSYSRIKGANDRVNLAFGLADAAKAIEWWRCVGREEPWTLNRERAASAVM